MDIPAPTPQIAWEQVVVQAIFPATAAVDSVAVAPDGRSLSVLLRGLQARCGDAGGGGTASAFLAASIAPQLPGKLDWKATRGEFRGEATIASGARATVTVGLGRAISTRILTADPSQAGTDVSMIETVFSDSDAVRVQKPSGEDEASFAPLTLTVQISLTCPASASAALVDVESIDVELWVR
jgi:hypothetical protein